MFNVPYWSLGFFHPWKHRLLNWPIHHLQVRPGIMPGHSKDWVSGCSTHSCVRVLLIVFIYQAVCCVCVRQPSAGIIPIGSVSLRVLRCWGVMGRGERYWLSNVRPRLCSWPKECRCTAQRDMCPDCTAAPPPPHYLQVVGQEHWTVTKLYHCYWRLQFTAHAHTVIRVDW